MTRLITLGRKVLQQAVMVCCALVLLGMSTGCNRAYYRKQADREVEMLIAQKSDDDRWAFPGFSIDEDEKSRYKSPHDLVRPPMPPDDPRSHELMHLVGGIKGYDKWHADGDSSQLENPDWHKQLLESTEQDEEGRIKLSLEEAIKLAVIHSPDYQSNLETLYLSAIDVSTERFRFDVQFFGGSDQTFQYRGGGFGSSGDSSSLTTDNTFQIRRRFATAGQLVVDFANELVWNFSGPDAGDAVGLVSFSIVQPLLRAGGRVVGLEQLTRAERTLLANMRSMQRYRQGFYTRRAIGESGGSQGPRRSGGFFGGTGLTGFTGQGAGGFSGVGAASGFGGGRFGGSGGGGGAGAGGAVAGVAGGGAGRVGGYIGLLQTLQELRNSQDNLALQVRTLKFLQASQEAGLIGIDQVLAFEQSIETGRASLLQARNGFQGSIESYVRSNLGLPATLKIVLDDTLEHGSKHSSSWSTMTSRRSTHGSRPGSPGSPSPSNRHCGRNGRPWPPTSPGSRPNSTSLAASSKQFAVWSSQTRGLRPPSASSG